MKTTLREAQIAIQIAIGCLFAFATVGKLLNPKEFTKGVAAYGIIPSLFVPPIAILVILAEGCVATGHLTGYLFRSCIRMGILLTGCFVIAVSINLVRGRTPKCHCFGSHGDVISLQTLMRLLLIGFGEIFLYFRSPPVYPFQLTVQDLVAGLPVAVVLSVIAVWVLSFNDLLNLFWPYKYRRSER